MERNQKELSKESARIRNLDFAAFLRSSKITSLYRKLDKLIHNRPRNQVGMAPKKAPPTLPLVPDTPVRYAAAAGPPRSKAAGSLAVIPVKRTLANYRSPSAPLLAQPALPKRDGPYTIKRSTSDPGVGVETDDEPALQRMKQQIKDNLTFIYPFESNMRVITTSIRWDDTHPRNRIQCLVVAPLFSIDFRPAPEHYAPDKSMIVLAGRICESRMEAMIELLIASEHQTGNFFRKWKIDTSPHYYN